MTSYGMDKFAHLVDKLHRTIALCDSLRAEKAQLERELEEAHFDLAAERIEKERIKSQLEFLSSERESLKLKAEAMLDAITMLELEADSAKK